MFRKIVSALPFSPALVEQLGFYVRRLKKEEVTRRLGLIFTILAVVMQSFTVFSPPEQALASSGSDVIPGGIKSVKQVIDVYDAGVKGQNDFKALMDYLGITRSELSSMSTKVEYVCSSDKDWISFGRQHRYSASQGELMHNVPKHNGGFSVFYSVPLHRFDSVNNRVNCYDSYIGKSAKAGKFSIMRKCGNIQIKKNIQKFPRGHFISATCKTIQGFAYDERQSGLPVKVFLFFDGPPGKGKQFGPITANQSTPNSPIGAGHGFSFSVAEEYRKQGRPVKVWAALQPLPGWNQATVQFDNTVEIPSNCVPQKTPFAACLGLVIKPIDRTNVRFEAKGMVDQGATISGYRLSILDSNGKKVYEKFTTSQATQLLSESISLPNSGDYKAIVVINTSIGEKTAGDCEATFKISPPNKCPYLGAGLLAANDPACAPCPYDDSVWLNDPTCSTTISQAKEARNLTQSIEDANGSTARPSDRIEFSVYTTNVGGMPATTTVTENLTDVLEYASLIDAGGGTFDAKNKVLNWGDVRLDAQKTDTRKFVVLLHDVIPATPRGGNDPAAYNCVMTNAYGNTIEIKVQCPPVKAVESAVKELPATGATENMLFAGGVLILTTYFYMRSRQVRKEAELIRKNYNLGAS